MTLLEGGRNTPLSPNKVWNMKQLQIFDNLYFKNISSFFIY